LVYEAEGLDYIFILHPSVREVFLEKLWVKIDRVADYLVAKGDQDLINVFMEGVLATGAYSELRHEILFHLIGHHEVFQKIGETILPQIPRSL